MVYLRAVLLMIGVLINLTASAQEKPSITIGYYEFPPISYTDSANNATGTNIELGRSLLTHAGYNVTFKVLPSARLYAQLVAGEVDLWIGAPGKPELVGHTQESSKMIGDFSLAVFYHPQAPRPRLPEDLYGKKIILIGGYSYWPPATQWLSDKSLNLTQTRANGHASAIAMLMRKRGDYLFDYLEPMHETQRQLGIHELSLPYIKIHSAAMTFIVSKRSKYAAQLLEDLELQFDNYSPARLYQHNQ